MRVRARKGPSWVSHKTLWLSTPLVLVVFAHLIWLDDTAARTEAIKTLGVSPPFTLVGFTHEIALDDATIFTADLA